MFSPVTKECTLITETKSRIKKTPLNQLFRQKHFDDFSFRVWDFFDRNISFDVVMVEIKIGQKT